MKTGELSRLFIRWLTTFTFCSSVLSLTTDTTILASDSNTLGGPTHLGTFEGSTTFTTSSSNGVNPGLYLEVLDDYGNTYEYTSEEGVITIPDTHEGAYITQAKLLGKTKYKDLDTGELLDTWEPNRNLALESVKMPVLTAVGKNLLNCEFELGWIDGSTGQISLSTLSVATTNTIKVSPSTQYSVTRQSGTRSIIAEFDCNNNYLGYVEGDTFKTKSNTSSIRIFIQNTTDKDGHLLCLGSNANEIYEPYKSNILTTNEEVELRKVGNVQDELNLLTGELTQRIGEIVLDGSEDWGIWGGYSGVADGAFILDNFINYKFISNMVVDKIIYFTKAHMLLSERNGISLHESVNRIYLTISQGFSDIQSLKAYLQSNPITVQYQLAESTVKTVVLNNTYTFPPVNTRVVQLTGDITPLICSVTTPTEALEFKINPNLPADKQFIAPEFSIINQTPATLSLELKDFSQTTDFFNDVIPDAHSNWSDLDQEQSKDFALALNPISSNGWKNLIEGPRYVADDSNYYLGEINPESRVHFTFNASHGRAFTRAFSPSYRLVFIFEF